MALDLNNKQQIESFTQQQLAKGRSPEEIEQFLSGKQQELTQQTRAGRAPTSAALTESLGGGALAQILGSVTGLAERPTRQALGNLEILGNLLQLEASRVLGSPSRELEEKIRTGQNVFLPPEAAQKIVQPTDTAGQTLEALEPTLRSAAGPAALLPGLGFLPGAAAGGAAALSEARASPAEILFSALGGGAVSGLLGKVLPKGATVVGEEGVATKVGKEAVETIAGKPSAQPLSFLKTLGTDVRQQITGLPKAAGDGVFFSSNLQRLSTIADEFTGSNKAKLAQIGDEFSALSKEAKTLLGQERGVYTVEEIGDTLQKSLLGTDLADGGAKAALRRITAKLDEAGVGGGGQIDKLSLFEDVLQDIGDQAKKSFKSEKSAAGVFTAKDEVLTKSYRAIKDLINEGSSNPVKALTERQSALIDISKPLSKKTEAIPVGIKQLQLEVPGLARPLQAGLDAAGRVGQKVGELSVPSVATTSKALSKILQAGGLSGKAAVKLAGIKSVGGVAGIVGGKVTGGKLAPKGITKESEAFKQLPDAKSTTITQDEMFMLSLLDPKNADVYKALFEMGGGEGGTGSVVTQINALPSAGERNKARATADILQVVRNAREAAVGVGTGPLSALGIKTTAALGGVSPGADLNQALKELLRTVRKESTGVAFSPQEITDLLEEIPSVGQQEATVENKLRLLETRMLQKLSGFGIDVPLTQ